MVRKLTPGDYVTTAWSGGTTTQLAIAPEGASYADRDFLWRISSATVTLEESDFTALPDYHRLIAMLRGEMTLTHNDGEPVTLDPYQVHAFEGGDRTHSRGCCTDFNLMLRRGKKDGSMEALRLSKEPLTYQPRPQTEELLLYCAEGDCVVSQDGATYALAKGETLRVSGTQPDILTLMGHGVLMLCQMWQL